MSERPSTRDRNDLRMQLRRQLEASEPGLRLVAQEVLALTSTIDLVGVDPHGRAVLVWIAEPERDLEAFARALAGRFWAAPRVRDWAQLSPSLELRPEAGLRALLLGTAFASETVAAASGAGGVELILWKPASNEFGPHSIEWIPLQAPYDATLPAAEKAVEVPVFRSGLSEGDLDLSPEERRDFD